MKSHALLANRFYFIATIKWTNQLASSRMLFCIAIREFFATLIQIASESMSLEYILQDSVDFYKRLFFLTIWTRVLYQMPLCNTSSTNHHLTVTALLNVPDYTMATNTDEILCNFLVIRNLIGSKKHFLVVGLYRIRQHRKFLFEPILVNEKPLSFSDHQ